MLLLVEYSPVWFSSSPSLQSGLLSQQGRLMQGGRDMPDPVALKECFELRADEASAVVSNNRLWQSKLCKECPQLHNHCL